MIGRGGSDRTSGHPTGPDAHDTCVPLGASCWAFTCPECLRAVSPQMDDASCVSVLDDNERR